MDNKSKTGTKPNTISTITDNVTGKSFSRDTSIAGSTFAPTGNLSTQASTIANTPINPTRITPSQGTYNPPTASTASNTAVAVDTVANRQPSVMPTPAEPVLTKSQTMLQKMLPSNPQIIQQEKAEARKNADLQNKMELSNKAQNEIKVQKRAYEDQIEKIRTNTDGKSTAQLNNEMNEFARKADKHLADKAITAELLLDNYTGAEKILNAQLEDMQQDYDNEVKSYQIAKDFIFNDLTDSEKAELDFQQQQKAADFNLERQKTLSEFNAKLEQASPLYRAQVASANRANQPDVTSVVPNALSLANKESSIVQLQGLSQPSAGMSSAVGTSFLTRSTGFWGSVGKVFTGLLGGAGAGAAVGSVVPGAGTIAGGVVGGIIGTGTSLVSLAKQGYSQLSGSEQNFIGNVSQIVGQLTVDKLAQAKSSGVTFGALSDGERGLVAESASTIKSFEIREGGKPEGKVIGYNASQKSMQMELNKINNFKRLDFIISGGTPESVGVQILADGSYQFKNPDGSISILYRQ